MPAGSYGALLNDTLLPSEPQWTAVDLFAGCGGLALGFESAGFQTVGFDMNSDSVATYQHNLSGECHELTIDTTTVFPDADVVIGGPPCQPFSVGGYQKGLADSRDGFPAFISAVEKVRPKVLLFENVRGMLYKNRWYLDEILGRFTDLGYTVSCELLNAVNYGVPQNRERLIVVGHQGQFAFPGPVGATVTAGDALHDLLQKKPVNAKWLTPSQDAYIQRYEEKSNCVTPRDLHLDRPARTLTCRNLAGATSDMHRIKTSNGQRRRLTVAEAARLQSFPDWFTFTGTDTSAYTQIGNAVAPMFARMLAMSVADALNETPTSNSLHTDKLF